MGVDKVKEAILIDDEFGDGDEEGRLEDNWCAVHEETRITEVLISRASSYLVSLENGSLKMHTNVVPLPED